MASILPAIDNSQRKRCLVKDKEKLLLGSQAND